MSIAAELESRVFENLDELPQPAGFSWSILITALLPILTDFLGSCAKRRTPEAVAKQLSEGTNNFWNRYAVRRAMRIVKKEGMYIPFESQKICADCVLEHIQNVDHIGLVNEITDNVSDWSLI